MQSEDSNSELLSYRGVDKNPRSIASVSLKTYTINRYKYKYEKYKYTITQEILKAVLGLYCQSREIQSEDSNSELLRRKIRNLSCIDLRNLSRRQSKEHQKARMQNFQHIPWNHFSTRTTRTSQTLSEAKNQKRRPRFSNKNAMTS